MPSSPQQLSLRESLSTVLIYTLESQPSSHLWKVSPVGGTYDENSLLVGHAIHLSEDLVDDTVCCTPTIPCTTTSCLGNGVQLIKKQDTRRCLPGLEEQKIM